MVMAYILMADKVIASVSYAVIVPALVSARRGARGGGYTVMADIVVAYIGMPHIVTACKSIVPALASTRRVACGR